MKTGLLILLWLPMIGFGQTLIPDANFEQALINLGYDTGSPNGSVPTANINTITFLDVSFTITPNSSGIADLTGIEDFTALTELNCRNNQLTSLDVSQNTVLTELNCQNNQLISLDVSQNTALIYLWCGNNQIECLEVISNTALITLNAEVNLLEQLNTKNGNFLNMNVNAESNNLTCVEVENINATANWLFDNGVVFNADCNYTNPCATVSAIKEHTTNKELLKITDLLGRETKGTKNEVLFYIYDDGTVEKIIIIE